MCEQLSTPVLLIFFNRPDTFEQVFQKVKKVKPRKLYLAQDGARPGNIDDQERILQCRKIAEDIDWDCEIQTNYSDSNLGCGLRPQTAISWVLEKEESVIILEDDCIPSLSFFYYCEELLEKYKDDQRICLISGLNHFEEWEPVCGKEADYFFCKTGAIWGWATWARAWKNYSYNLDKYTKEDLKAIASAIGNSKVGQRRLHIWQETIDKLEAGENISYWDYQWGIVRYAQSQFTIVPKKNLITNIGVGAYSTHAKDSDITIYKRFENFVFMPSYELEFPLTHPFIMVNETKYDGLVYKINFPGTISKYLKIVRDHLKG